jgi:hypothetical protein
MLIAVPEDRVAPLLTALRKEKTPAAARIGRIVGGPPGTIAVS